MVNSAFIKQFTNDHPATTLIAVTKYTDVQGIQAFYDVGVRDFGENRAMSISQKQPHFPSATWHFIGHLQTNKVKQVLPFINVLHSLDRVSLAEEINKRAQKPLDCFIQVKTSNDDKYGCDLEDVDELVAYVSTLKNINIIGFMTMAALHATEEELKESFQTLQTLKQRFNFPYLSMGMSDDYRVALQYGATHVRLGRILYKGDVHEFL